MKKIKLFIILSFCILNVCNRLYAQQTNVWAFGQNAGVDFSSGSPVPIYTSISPNSEDNSFGSICDASGQLLFYTDGDTVYDKNGIPMPNGNGIAGVIVNYTTAGVIIVPMPDSANKYYVFSTSAEFYGNAPYGGLYYGIVDMSLNNGLGDVVEKGIQLDSNVISGVTAIVGSDCNIWLVYRLLPFAQFKAYNIDASGINPNPIISGQPFNDTISASQTPISYLAVSPNHKKIASVLKIPYANEGGVQLFDFDSTTGVVSNEINITVADGDVNQLSRSACFSPDNSKLYVKDNNDPSIIQYDLTNPDSASIAASSTYLGNCLLTDMRLGPDNKIYFIATFTTLGAIELPNLAGAACQYNPSVVQALPGTEFGDGGFGGLPNTVPVIKNDTVFASVDTAVVSGTAIAAPSGYSSYKWNDGTTNAQKTITTAGTYWVIYANYYCQQYVDTFHVSISNEGIPSLANTSMNVYPNPAQSELTITINAIGQINGDIQIVNVLGQVVLQQPCTQNKQVLNVSTLETGAYIINYISKDAGMPTLKAHILICK